MKKILIFSLMIVFMATLNSCNLSGTSPEKVFTTIGLNGNKIPRNFKRAFDEIRGQKKVGNLKIYSMEKKDYISATAEEYVNGYYIIMFDDDIKKIEALSTNEEN